MRISPASVRLSRHLTRLSLAVLVLLLAASCHSTQVAYQFRPAPSYATSNAATKVAPDSVMISALVAVTAATPATAAPVTASKPVQASLQPARQIRRVVAYKIGQQLTRATASRSAAQRMHQAARPHQMEEVGLGTTVFGVLGLIVLPISLIGLLIWGGPIWAILAGLSALAILIAYLDPFG
ncbi:hypothetical protein [Hymenobacter norwichensis]|uniref:hypothetical protein n=1 Tax=Hymenobacter norwichensis TaxID=223903 RepID=UPI0003B65AA7|nr:hypothetical protein [Hymenobacter norwichensis]